MKFSEDKNKLYIHFLKSPVLFSYLIGDLDDFYFPLCKWPVLENEDGNIDDAILIFNNPRFVCVQALGLTSDFPKLLQDTIQHLPDSFYCHYLTEYKDIFLEQYEEKPLSSHWKMKLESYKKSHSETDDVKRLSMSDYDAVFDLYETAYPDRYFDERLLATGKFFGIFDGDKIIAIAGVHVYSKQYKIAVLGSITTHPDYRGKGLATKVSSRIIEDLKNYVELITLNVQDDNLPAIRCYEKLGFVKHCEYEEAHFTRRGIKSD